MLKANPPKDELTELEYVQTLIEAEQEFYAGFKRSKKGNLWRTWQQLTVVVFKRQDVFAWSIANDDGVKFSTKSFSTEEDAIENLWKVLRQGE